MKYIFNSRGEPEACDDVLEWGRWYEVACRRVALTNVGGHREGISYIVSTVFLGVDHNHFKGGTPILWETMVFRGDEGLWFDRCGGSREQAEAMHENMCRILRGRIKNMKSQIAST